MPPFRDGRVDERGIGTSLPFNRNEFPFRLGDTVGRFLGSKGAGRVGAMQTAENPTMQPLLRAFPLVLWIVQAFGGRERFTEELLLRPLPNGHLMAHFHFQLAAERGEEPSQGFPHAIAHLAQAHANVKDVQLRLTSGRWNYRKWGRPPQPASPVGAELVMNYVPVDEETDLTLWRNLTHALGGLFCTSLSFLADGSKHIQPKYFPIGGPFRERTTTRYGVLPREAVCTENLTPWLKLLPCRDVAGIGSLLRNRRKLYDSLYHSMGSHLQVTDKLLVLTNTILLVIPTGKYSKDRISRNWALEEQLGKVQGPCPSAQSSHVYVQASKSLPGGADMKGGLSLEETAGFSLSPAAPSLLDCEAKDPSGKNATISRSTLLDYPLMLYSKQKPLRLELEWKEDVKAWEPEWPLFIAHNYITRSTADSGSIAYEFRRRTTVPILGAPNNKLQVCLFQYIPWFVRVWIHTLTVGIDGQLQPEGALALHYIPSRDRVQPTLIELCFDLPKTAKHALLTLEFQKMFLRRTEYPTDASRGEDIPAAVASVIEIFPDNITEVGKLDSTWKSIEAFPLHGVPDDVTDRPLLQLLEKFPTQHIYLEGLMISLTIPDFSMPYNVCTISSTVVSFAFTSLLVLLVKPKPAKDAKEDKYRKVKKAAMLAAFAILMAAAAARDAGYI